MHFLSSTLVFASAIMLSQIQATPFASGLSAVNSFKQASHVLKRSANATGTDSNTTNVAPTEKTGNATDSPNKNASTTNPESVAPSANATAAPSPAANSTASDPTESTKKTTTSDPESEAKAKAAKEAIAAQKKVTKAQWRKFKDEEEKLQKMINDHIVSEMKSFKPPSMPKMGSPMPKMGSPMPTMGSSMPTMGSSMPTMGSPMSEMGSA